jgi:hypothetical protein
MLREIRESKGEYGTKRVQRAAAESIEKYRDRPPIKLPDFFTKGGQPSVAEMKLEMMHKAKGGSVLPLTPKFKE